MKELLLNFTSLFFIGVLAFADTGEPEKFFSAYCHKCHDEETQKGDLRLDSYMDRANFAEDRKVWLSVLEQLETEEMPPKEPFPVGSKYATANAFFEESVNSIDWETYKPPGHVTLPRLTKTEYNTAIRDLFGLDIQPGRNFTADGEGQTGFTNDRDNLFVSSADLEKYLVAAELTIEALRSLQKLACFLERMKGIKEGDSNLLENSIVLYGSGMKDGNGHIKNDLPLVVAGHGGGRFRQGQRIVSAKGTPHSNLLHTLGLATGLEQESFNGVSTGLVDGLLV